MAERWKGRGKSKKGSVKRASVVHCSDLKAPSCKEHLPVKAEDDWQEWKRPRRQSAEEIEGRAEQRRVSRDDRWFPSQVARQSGTVGSDVLQRWWTNEAQRIEVALVRAELKVERCAQKRGTGDGLANVEICKRSMCGQGLEWRMDREDVWTIAKKEADVEEAGCCGF